MFITWYGQSALKIQTKSADGKTVILAIDPQSLPEAGLKNPFFKTDIIISTKQSKQKVALRPAEEKIFFIDKPGEYEVKGIFISGVAFSEELTIYRINSEDMIFVHLGQLSKLLSDEQLEKLNGVDILTVPVGGKTVLAAEKASKIISEIEPRLVVPIYYKIPGLKIKLDPLSKFLKEMGSEAKKGIDKLRIIKKELPSEGTEIMILKNV